MATERLGSLRDFLGRLAKPVTAEEPDAGLVGRFAASGDAAAFAALVRRHGPLVWGVCRRVLGHEQDAEDAFQAAFLVLARGARSVRRRQSVRCWLYGVALRVALRARRYRAKRHAAERAAVPPSREAAAVEAWADVRPVLDEEIGRLPERYRL